MMKTSEYIRECVDRYLTPSDREIGMTFLCNVVSPGKWPNPPITTSNGILHILHIISKELKPDKSCLDTTPSIDGAIGQQERFMFAEFMALYFEDLGD